MEREMPCLEHMFVTIYNMCISVSHVCILLPVLLLMTNNGWEEFRVVWLYEIVVDDSIPEFQVDNYEWYHVGHVLKKCV